MYEPPISKLEIVLNLHIWLQVAHSAEQRPR